MPSRGAFPSEMDISECCCRCCCGHCETPGCRSRASRDTQHGSAHCMPQARIQHRITKELLLSDVSPEGCVCACVCVCARAPFCFFVGFYSQDGSWLLKFHNLEGNGLHRNKLNHNAEFVLSSVSVCPSVRPPPPPPLLSLSLSLPLSSQRGSARGGPAPTAPPAPLPRGAAGRCGPGPRPRSARRSAFSSAARCRRGAPPYRSWVAGGVASLLGSFWGGGEAFVWVVRLGRFRLFGLVSVARFAFQSGSGENPGCQLFCPPSGAQGRACSSCWC